MSARLAALRIAASDPPALARFWAELLDWQVVAGSGGEAVAMPPDGVRPFRLHFVSTDVPKTTQNLMHFDLTSQSAQDQQARVARVLELGGSHVDIGQSGDEGHVVLGDPEGNEVDVIEPGNRFLAGCGLIGCVASDGSRAVGEFWSNALGWPLVWDEGEETAIQAPYGGTKISWGGPPYADRAGADRWTYEVETDGELEAEIARLTALGARLDGPAEETEPAGAGVRMRDPDGNRFTLTEAAAL